MSPTPDAFFDAALARASWTALAAIHGPATRYKTAVRQQRGSHRWVYPPSTTRPWTPDLPHTPAAVYLYTPEGTTSVLAFDFDKHSVHTSHQQVEHDAAQLFQWLTTAGLHPIASQSVRGGIHVWVRLPHPVHHTDIQPLLRLLTPLLPTLDPTPLTGATQGCIRPPGSPHRMGGYQTLRTPLPHAAAQWAAAPDLNWWPRLHTQITTATTTATQAAACPPVSPLHVTRTHTHRPLNLRYRGLLPPHATALARTGSGRRAYASRSHAAFAVLCSAVAVGFTLDTFTTALRTPDNGWTWLADYYASKRPGLLTWDFTHAETAHQAWRHHGSGPVLDTSASNSRRARHATDELCDETRFYLRQLATYATQEMRTRRYPPNQRAVLRAVLWAALVQGSLTVSVGVRSLGEQADVSRTTAGKLLHRLADDGWITKTKDHAGQRADHWEVLVEQAAHCRPSRALLLGVHPAFRGNGEGVAQEVYDALADAARHDTTVTTADLVTRLGYSRQRVHATLRLLASDNLARQDRGRWQVGAASLDAVAAANGGAEDWQTQHDQHVAERAQYQATLNTPIRAIPHPRQEPLPLNWTDEFALAAPDPHAWIAAYAAATTPRVRSRGPTADPDQTVALLRTALGAVVIAS